MKSGTTVESIDASVFYGLRVHVPPLAEQRRIAEILDTVDEAIRKTEQLIAKLQQVRQGLLHDLLTRGIDENGELRNPDRHPEQFKDSPLGWIPRDWGAQWLSYYLSEGDGIKPGPFGSSLTKASYAAHGFRVYGQEQVIAGSLQVGEYFIPESRFLEMSSFEVLEGDILMSLVGTIGRVLVVRSPFERGIINPRLVRLRPSDGITGAEFLKHLLASSVVTRQLDRSHTGGTMPVLNGRIMRALRVPQIPSGERVEIARILDDTDRRAESERSSVEKLRLLKQGLTNDLLTGRVRVIDLEGVG